MTRQRFNRILLKLSGEALMGQGQFGIDPDAVAGLAGQLQKDAFEPRSGHGPGLSFRCNKGGHAFMAQPPCCQLPCSSCSR